MHTYVIHLQHRHDRKEQFEEAHQDHQGKIHWHAATLGSALPAATLQRFKTVAKTRKAALKRAQGRAGCYCSHKAAIAKAIKQDHFPLLILEDDAVPTEAGRGANLSDIFAAAPEANLLYFGALPVKDRKRVKSYCQQKQGWQPVRSDTKLYGGHAYGFKTKAAAQELLAFLEANRITFDSALVRYVKQHPEEAAVHCPFLFVQSEGYSNIEGALRPTR